MDEQMRNKLHGEIMNIRCAVPDSDGKPCDFALAYKLGHRDARHAAAELFTTSAALSQPAAADEVKAELLGALQQLADELNDVLFEGGASPFSSQATQRTRAAIAKATP